MGLLDKMFGHGGAKGAVKDMVAPATKEERMRREYDERIAREPDINRAYLLRTLETKYEHEPKHERREPQHQMRPREQQERRPKEKSMWDKFVEMGQNVNTKIERESGFMGGGGDFGGGFGEIDLNRIAGFGSPPRQEKKYYPKKHKKQHKTKSSGKTIIIQT